MTWILLIFFNALSPSVFSENRALIIGNNTNLAPELDIKKDLEMMRKVLYLWGLSDNEIIELEDITLAKLRTSFHQLSKAVEKTDKVIIYFTGHGAQIHNTTGNEKELTTVA